MARLAGIEPASLRWRRSILPLNDSSVGAAGAIRTLITWLEAKGPTLERRTRGGEGFHPRPVPRSGWRIDMPQRVAELSGGD